LRAGFLLPAAPLLLLLVAAGPLERAPAAPAQPPVSYSRQIQPLFEKQCVGCHGGPSPASGFSMTSRDLLLKGGRHGAAVVPGKGAGSPLVQYLTGERQPKMPPGGAPPLDLDTVALIRRWIDEGARFDAAGARPARTASATRAAPPQKIAAGAAPAPVTALAYSPDGGLLALAGYRAVRLLDPATGTLVRTLVGPSDQVQALAWSGDNQRLAVAGGSPGEGGEVIVFDTRTWRPVRTLRRHADVVYAVAWKPGTRDLATGSLDKTVRLWKADFGTCVGVLKDHADAVLSVVYSPDGKLFASGSADRSVKLFDVSTGKRLAALTAHQDAVTRVCFNHDGSLLATAGADKTLRVWKVEVGKMENPLRTLHEDDAVNACAFSGDGGLLVYGTANRVVKQWSGDGAQHRRTLSGTQDWVYAVAVSPDNRTLAAATHDGSVLFWDAGEGKLVRAVRLQPGGKGVKVEIATTTAAAAAGTRQ
jgi:WD40 repeat protein